MSKSVLVWGAPSMVDPNTDVSSAFAQSGNNFGNILIGNAIRTILSNEAVIGREQVSSPSEVNERCSQVVIPAANFLWKDFDFGYMLSFLEKTAVPVTIIGVGAQTNDRTVSSPIHPNTLRLMHLIAERSSSLGVRGYYTAEVLASNGIHNTTVIGCPSLYTKRTPVAHILREHLEDSESIAVNFSRRVHRHAFNPKLMQRVENALMKLALGKKSSFVAQDELTELNLAQGSEVDTREIEQYFNESDSKVVVDYFRNNTRHFRNVDEWSSFIRAKSYSIGTRFHGNLIALLNGIPALMIVHDSRTYEMCALMNIPMLHISQVQESDLNVETLEERVRSADYGPFERAYTTLYRRFVRFLDDNGLHHNLIRAVN